MSTSTVSVNPRRRISSTINDVKQSIDIVSVSAAANLDDKLAAANNATDNPAANDGGEATSAAGKVSSSSGRSRNRKAASSSLTKHSKPRWKTVLSVLVKNLVLVIVLLGLVQLVRNLTEIEVEGVSKLGFFDMERRIVAVETLVKTSAKMMQVQVDVVEQKVDSEVVNLRREIVRRVDDKRGEIDGKLNELGAKNEGLETELRELRGFSKGFVSKDDVIRVYEEFRSGNEGSEASLSEIRGLAREIVEKEMEKHVADGLGRVDYAVGSGGGRIVKHSEPLIGGKGFWFSESRQGVHESAVRMLSPSFGEPGMCFALKGSSGFVEIRLRTAIVPEAITLEHVAKSVAYDQSSAPKDCRVFGWLQGLQGDKAMLTEFTYDLEKSNAQTYSVVGSAVSAVIDTVRFEFSSNHGNLQHTCIYRLRVHGHDSELVAIA